MLQISMPVRPADTVSTLLNRVLKELGLPIYLADLAGRPSGQRSSTNKPRILAWSTEDAGSSKISWTICVLGQQEHRLGIQDRILEAIRGEKDSILHVAVDQGWLLGRLVLPQARLRPDTPLIGLLGPPSGDEVDTGELVDTVERGAKTASHRLRDDELHTLFAPFGRSGGTEMNADPARPSCRTAMPMPRSSRSTIMTTARRRPTTSEVRPPRSLARATRSARDASTVVDTRSVLGSTSFGRWDRGSGENSGTDDLHQSERSTPSAARTPTPAPALQTGKSEEEAAQPGKRWWNWWSRGTNSTESSPQAFAEDLAAKFVLSSHRAPARPC